MNRIYNRIGEDFLRCSKTGTNFWIKTKPDSIVPDHQG